MTAPNDIGVIFATPCLSSNVSIDYHMSMVRMIYELIKKGINHGFLYQPGDPYLSKVRNKIVTNFLEQYPAATDLFFIDDDVGFPADAVMRFLDNPAPVLAGIYPKKSDILDFPTHLKGDPETGTLIERDGLVEAVHVPTGFLRVKRWVLEKMAEISGIFYDGEADGTIRAYHNVFEMGVNKDRWFIGEDFAFCEKWTEMGGEVMVDPNIDFTHRGSKNWKCNLAVDGMAVFREKAKTMKQEANGADPQALWTPSKNPQQDQAERLRGLLNQTGAAE